VERGRRIMHTVHVMVDTSGSKSDVNMYVLLSGERLFAEV
jgi:hypothetical protein